MQEKLGKATLNGFTFFGISIPLLALIITIFAYFEVFSNATISKLLFGAFVIIFFLGTSTIAKKVGQRGWMVGLTLGGGMVLLNLMFVSIGLEGSLDLQFLVRSAITMMVTLTGGMIGVNLKK